MPVPLSRSAAKRRALRDFVAYLDSRRIAGGGSHQEPLKVGRSSTDEAGLSSRTRSATGKDLLRRGPKSSP